MTSIPQGTAADDVRMRGFKQRVPVEHAWAWLDRQQITLEEQTTTLQDAGGRMLAEDVVSDVDIPGFVRSMMDGYAIVAADTYGASVYQQLPLRVIGQSMPNNASSVDVVSGAAVKIMTGSPVPQGADAVLPAENVEIAEREIFVMESVAEGRNIGRIGEDVRRGDIALHQGRRLRPQDIGLLAAIGRLDVNVYRKPSIRIVVTGNELLPVGTGPQGHQIVNSNGPMLETLVNRDGGNVVDSRLIPDDPNQLREALLNDVDILLVSGASSVGEEDYAPLMLAELGELAVHGITMRPSRSTGLGRIGDTCVFLLPGNPVACLCAYDFFAARLIRKLSGFKSSWPYTQVTRKLKNKISSMIGRTDYARVRISDDGFVEPVAISGAANLSSTTNADGFVVIPADNEGYAAHTPVDVFLYD